MTYVAFFMFSSLLLISYNVARVTEHLRCVHICAICAICRLDIISFLIVMSEIMELHDLISPDVLHLKLYLLEI